jgi:hypothetical protein
MQCPFIYYYMTIVIVTPSDMSHGWLPKAAVLTRLWVVRCRVSVCEAGVRRAHVSLPARDRGVAAGGSTIGGGDVATGGRAASGR